MTDRQLSTTAVIRGPTAGRDGDPGPGFTRRVSVVAAVALLTVGAAAAFVKASDVFFLFFAAILLAILLRAASDALDRRTKLGPRWSFGLVLFALAAAAAAGLYLAGSTAVTQFNQLVADLPRSADRARDYVRRYPWGDEALRQAPTAEELATGGAGNAASSVTRFFSTTFGVFGNLLVLTASALYLAASPGTYVGGLVRLVPPARRERARQVLVTIGAQLRWWLLGRLVAMASVGLVVGAGLWLVGVPQYLVLALVAAVTTAIPYVGPIIGAVPGILVALIQGPTAALWALGVYALAQVVENYLVTPLVQQRMVDLPPVLTIAAIAVVGALFGVLGLIVATPLAVAVMTAVKLLYVEDVLGDDMAVPGGGRSA
jgi:predicted PurR-regulated permease PerM